MRLMKRKPIGTLGKKNFFCIFIRKIVISRSTFFSSKRKTTSLIIISETAFERESDHDYWSTSAAERRS